MMKIIIPEKKFNEVLKIIKEQNESDIFEIGRDEFYKLARLASFNLNSLSKIKKFQGKPIKVIGSLDLSNTDTNSLGNVVEVTGDLMLNGLNIQKLGNLKRVGGVLDISNSKVSRVDGVSYSSLRKWGSTLEKLEIARIERETRLEANQRRVENVWDVNNDDISDIGLMANALFNYLVYQDNLNEISDEQKEVLESLKSELSELNDQYENAVDPQEANSLVDRINDIEVEIEEITEDSFDVYDIIPKKYTHYGLTNFEVIGLDRGVEYAVGTEEEVEVAALEYAKSVIDDTGVEGFSPGYIEHYVDGDEVADYFEESYRDMIYDSPESYFDEDELGLTEEQEERIEYLEEKISEYQEQIEKHEYDSDEYGEIEEIINELQEELDSIEPLDTPTDEMVEEKVNEILSDIRLDPISHLKDYELDLKNFIDTDALAQGMVDDDGYGILSSYDSSYDTQDVNGETYYIFRLG